MAIRRRWPVMIILALIVLFLLQKLDFLHFLPSFTDDVQSTPYTPEQSVDDDRFHWEKLPLRYPVSSYAHLPKRNTKLPQVQHAFGHESAEAAVIRQKRQQEVKRVLQRCWSSYRERAWLSDELAPVTGSKKDTFGGWAATLADTLDTLWIADLKKEFHDGVEALLEIDFTKYHKERSTCSRPLFVTWEASSPLSTSVETVVYWTRR
jgi:mannosyl-oligosaccharide alpha-1,2-mannosidase